MKERILFIGGSFNGQWREIEQERDCVQAHKHGDRIGHAEETVEIETYIKQRWRYTNEQREPVDARAYVSTAVANPITLLLDGYRPGVQLLAMPEVAQLRSGEISEVAAPLDKRALREAREDCMCRTGREPVVSILVADPGGNR